MAYTEIATYVTNQLITAAHANTNWRDNINELWPYTAAGDIAYASAASTLAALAKGEANQILKMNAGATAPMWGKGAQLLDWQLSAAVSQANIVGSDWQDITDGSVTLTLPVDGIVIAIATAEERTDGGNGYNAFFRVMLDGEGGSHAVAHYDVSDYSTVTSFHIKSCAAGSIIAKMQAYAYLTNRADINTAKIMAFAFPT